MKNLSKKEIEIISDLEFQEKYYFKREDIQKHFVNKKQMINTIHNLIKKERIVNLSENKYFLIPIKARTGKWSDNSYIIADEMFNGEKYFIGGWEAASYWRLTDQIPFKTDVYTTKRQGRTKVLNTTFIFHRTTSKRIDKVATTEKIKDHTFKIQNKEETQKWLKRRN